MRKSLSTSLSDSLSTARVFGIPLEEVQHSGQPGHEVPLLVRSIVEYIEEHGGLHLEGLFLVNGNAERVEWLRQRYDSGVEVDLEKEADLASAVSLLRLFLQELPEPIIPAGLQAQILQLYQDYSSEEEMGRNMKYFLQQLPQVNYSLLRFLCRFLSGVASLQEESWSIGALAAVFGPDIFHLDTDVEDLKEQESVSRILAELLENQEEFFETEDEDISNTNDYSSINDQISELLEEEKLEACEELPRDSEDGPSSLSPKHEHVAPSSSSHIASISILPGSTDIIQRTIRAAVEQHLLDLQTSIDKELSSYERQVLDSQPIQGNSPTPKIPEDQEDVQSESDAETETLPEKVSEDGLPSESSEGSQGSQISSPATEESSGMDLDTETLVDADDLNTERLENYPDNEQMDQAEDATCEPGECDLNANTEPTELTGDPQSLSRSMFMDTELEASCPTTFPLIDFTCMHLQREGSDPMPVFMSWQEETELGEAQLSPLAARMIPLPLEEDAQPLLDRRFLDFGQSQRFLQQDHDATSSAKALSCGRPRRASLTSKDSMKGDTHQLTKKLQSLKKKIKQFEEQFEKERNYKPSHAERAADPKVLKWMTDLTKIRRQLKGRQHPLPKGSLRHQAVLQSLRRHSSSSSVPNTPHFTLSRPLNASRQAPLFYAKHKIESELTTQTRPRSNTLPKSFGSTLEQSAHEGPAESEARGHRPTREETLEIVQQRIKAKREEDGWPEDIRKMTKEELFCEKTVLQKNLLFYEGLHGRPVTRDERLIVKHLYDRYRLVKQMLTRVSITPIIASPSSKRRNQMLQPIIEGETAHFCGEIEEEEEDESRGQQENEEMQDEGSEIIMDPVAQTSSKQPSQETVLSSGKLNFDLRLSSSNASSMPELLEQLWKARAEKKKLRKTIREFEDEFYQQNGRNVQKEDRTPMMDEYKEYKRIKAKLRLLEVLISKQDSSKSI
nr:protein FAM13B isoform X1 [Misgurnus anguillicaudatus]XP_055033592.1 protein FAM13B isoform X1 [Misgurnus anguillicaudatus]XP_055033593.1 protein FAM13B isoform X1 [Misgurnus anguillicaudatus]XP_055033594.1 protein FAM13B isoform X1 [Misgurnus anguillicaudatus]